MEFIMIMDFTVLRVSWQIMKGPRYFFAMKNHPQFSAMFFHGEKFVQVSYFFLSAPGGLYHASDYPVLSFLLVGAFLEKSRL